MITFIFRAKNKYCREIIKFFDDQKLEYELVPWSELKREHLVEAAKMCDNLYELLNSGSQTKKFINEEMSFNQFIDTVLKKKSLLALYIIFDDKNFLSKYTDSEIRMFVRNRVRPATSAAICAPVLKLDDGRGWR